MKIRDREVLIPTSIVGNYPNPRWWDTLWATNFSGDQASPDAKEREALEDAIATMAHDQEMAGLDIISDGRVQGDNYVDQIVYYYLKRLGYSMHGEYLATPLYSDLHSATCHQEIKRYGPIMIQQARALKRATDKPIKVQYTGVQALAQCTNDHYYKSSYDRAMAIAVALNEELLELDEMGVDFIQLDEFTWPYLFEDWAIEAYNRCVAGVKNSKIVTHVCWGNYKGTYGYYMAEGADDFDITKRAGENPANRAESIVPKCYEANLDVINIENCGRCEGELDVLKTHPLPDNLYFWAGVIDIKSTIVETADQVADRIRGLLKYVPADRLGVTTDCGLIHLWRYIAYEKMRALVEGTKIVREELQKESKKAA